MEVTTFLHRTGPSRQRSARNVTRLQPRFKDTLYDCPECLLTQGESVLIDHVVRASHTERRPDLMDHRCLSSKQLSSLFSVLWSDSLT